ncbi:hypothetical protein MKK69_06945 [Methylobacterium sp. J-026]|uniref:hypothetical protein n=1 Tax=Methylobacterium sp. J-026 TaxID=2836624 RepID=UPI001FBA52BF|nr:hypothetical protein [Methylobacterium sp. J-026]MCJ2133806.1 hypothetical protein [Methylobacterium sp. J-026]
MTRTLTFLSLAAFLAAPVAEAHPARNPAKPGLSAAIKARQSAMNDFSARMSRLDGLMGVRPATPVRTRSAEAGR